MGSNYHYLDPEYKYADKKGLLRNLANIEDEKVLLVYESLKVTKRVEELLENPLKIEGSNSLLRIHHHLFQDIYEWAGQVRTVNISKDGKPFFDGERFKTNIMKKNYLTLVVIIMTTTLFAQNKKEQIATLTSQIDSLNMELQIIRNNASTEAAKMDSIITVLELEINVLTDTLNVFKSNVADLIEKEKKLSEEFQKLNSDNEKLKNELETKGRFATIITHDAVGKVKLGMSLDELEGIAIVIKEIIGLGMDDGQEVIIATFVDDCYTVAVSCDNGNPRRVFGIAALGPNFVSSDGLSMPMTVEQLKILYPDLTWGSGERSAGYFLTTELSNMWFFVPPSNIPDTYSYWQLGEDNKFPADITVSYIGVGWGVSFF